MTRIKRRYKLPVIQDPLTQIKTTCSAIGYHFIKEKVRHGTMTIIFTDKVLVERFTKDPTRLQNYPFLLDDHWSGPILIKQIINFYKHFKEPNELTVNCEWKELETLYFYRKVQHQRWMYNE